MEKLQGTIEEHLTKGIKTEKSTISDCVKFHFNIEVLECKGEFCKSGTLECDVNVLGVKVKHLKVDLSKGEFCNTISIGVEEVKYCFYMKSSCLYTKGYVDGWLHEKKKWDTKIICI